MEGWITYIFNMFILNGFESFLIPSLFSDQLFYTSLFYTSTAGPIHVQTSLCVIARIKGYSLSFAWFPFNT